MAQGETVWGIFKGFTALLVDVKSSSCLWLALQQRPLLFFFLFDSCDYSQTFDCALQTTSVKTDHICESSKHEMFCSVFCDWWHLDCTLLVSFAASPGNVAIYCHGD